MKKSLITLGGIALITTIIAGISIFLLLSSQQKENNRVEASPCTRAATNESSTPCVVETREIPGSGYGFSFRYPENNEVTQSSLDFAMIEDESSYLMTFYYNEHVSPEVFSTLFVNETKETLAGLSVLKSNEAKFPNPLYPNTTAYYLENNGKKAMVIIAADDREKLNQAEAIFIEGFSWE